MLYERACPHAPFGIEHLLLGDDAGCSFVLLQEFIQRLHASIVLGMSMQRLVYP